MSLSRIEAERFLSPREAVDLGEIARLAADHAAPLTESRDCSVELRIEEGLPPVVGDFGQLLQTADNLIGNAIRYGCTQDKGTVTIDVRRDGDRAVFTVSDAGEGIAAEHLPRVTERFYRVDAARSRDSGGTGLGLAIVKAIADARGGSVTFDTGPSGTTFTLVL